MELYHHLITSILHFHSETGDGEENDAGKDKAASINNKAINVILNALNY